MTCLCSNRPPGSASVFLIQCPIVKTSQKVGKKDLIHHTKVADPKEAYTNAIQPYL